MAARAIWKGVVTFGDVRVPVKLYSAIEDRTVHFHLLHRRDLVRVKQRMVHPETGDEVPPDERRKGWLAAPGKLVVLDESELAALEPEASREIRVLRFVDPGAIGPAWYDRPYWLGPDEGAEEDHGALVAALGARGKEGVASWTMRKKEYVGSLRVDRGRLALITLRHADEVIPRGELEAPGGRKLDERERKLAAQLVAALEESFDPADYRDTYRESVLELIGKKSRGERIELERYEPPPRPESLADALTASLAGARKRRAHG